MFIQCSSFYMFLFCSSDVMMSDILWLLCPLLFVWLSDSHIHIFISQSVHMLNCSFITSLCIWFSSIRIQIHLILIYLYYDHLVIWCLLSIYNITYDYNLSPSLLKSPSVCLSFLDSSQIFLNNVIYQRKARASVPNFNFFPWSEQNDPPTLHLAQNLKHCLLQG